MKRQGMVVCPQPEAAESGIEILQAGGNAVDAAVACALAQTAVDPLMCGIAGFGTGAVYLPGSGVHEYFDFHAPAPSSARGDMWEALLEGEARDGFGFVLKGRVNDLGYESIAVPGTLKGLDAMHRAYGRLPWSRVVQPAIAWARDGYFVRPGMHAFWTDPASMGRVSNIERLAFSEAGRKLYCLSDGMPKPIGTPLVNPDYARTLELIASEGADTFYCGEIAERICADLNKHGALLAQRDLSTYRISRNAPLYGHYRDRLISTNNPPGGGAMLIEMLNILENFDLQSLRHNSPDYIRTVCEAMKVATKDKDASIGDPAFLNVPLDRLLSKEYAKDVAQQIKEGKVFEVQRLNYEAVVPKDTTHLSVVDGEGNCVSLTHSLGMPSGVISNGLGFMYNGCMGVFDPRPGRTGSIAPGKSRFSSICPSIIFRHNRPEIVIGAPGGTQIAMGVLQAILNVVDFGMAMQPAISAPRFSSTSNAIDVSNRIPRIVTRDLENAGYQVVRNPHNYTIAWVHGIRDIDGLLDGGADPGRDGVAMSVDMESFV